MKIKHARSSKSAVITNPRWVAYATASAASALACVPTADGDIHYSGPINQHFNATPGGGASQAYFPLDLPLSQGGNSINPLHIRLASPFSDFGAAIFAFYGNAPAVAGFSASVGNGTYAYASKLSFGQAVSARPFLANGNATSPGAYGWLGIAYGRSNSQWLDAGIGFVGFRFDNGSGPQYGWARLVMDGIPVHSFTLVDFAWGDLGDSVAAGQVPEPGSLALLALGGAGLMAWRKRRSKTIAA